MKQEILDGVGKKTRQTYLRGEMTEDTLMRIYKQNKKEADEFSMFGMKRNDLKYQLNICHNPILKQKLKEALTAFEQKVRISEDQNKQSLEKLNGFLHNAINGYGLKHVINKMKHEVRKTKDKTMAIVTTLLEAELANLKAKSFKKELKTVTYERKSILLDKVADLLKGSNWHYGYNTQTGKNASYLIFVYLPNGKQLSWHSTDYYIYQKFPSIDAQWDGEVCSTLTKLLDYVKEMYGSFFGRNEIDLRMAC